MTAGFRALAGLGHGIRSVFSEPRRVPISCMGFHLERDRADLSVRMVLCRAPRVVSSDGNRGGGAQIPNIWQAAGYRSGSNSFSRWFDGTPAPESPESLLDEPPNLVVVMNPVYEEEIGQDLEEMGASAEIVSV